MHAEAPPMADGWYSGLEGVRDPGLAVMHAPIVRRLPQRLLRRMMAFSPTRGALLFAASTVHPAVGITREDPGWAVLLALRALFGRRRKLVVFQMIVHDRRHPLRHVLHAFDRWAIRRALLRGHALTRAEAQELPARYGMAVDRFVYVPWPLSATAVPSLSPAPETPLVLSAGRSFCDWETLFAAAKGSGWPLVVVCARRDRRRVERLNAAAGRPATVHVELDREAYERLVARATVSVVAMVDTRRSQGHVRLMDAMSRGVPVVASATISLSDYVEDDRSGILVEPGDALALRAAVDRLLADGEARERIRAEAHRRACGYRVADYFAALGDLVDGRPVRLTADAPGAAVSTR